MEYKRENDLDNFVIPNCVLRPALKNTARELAIRGRDGINGNTQAVERVLFHCGSEFAHVPLDMLRNRIGKVTRNPSKHGGDWTFSGSKNRGQRPVEPFSEEYKEWILSDEWKAFAKMITEAWGGKCAICYGLAKQVHHRTYERMKEELPTDVIPVCKACHKLADGRRRRTAERMKASVQVTQLF